MAVSDFFRDVGTGIFKPVGDFVSGAVTALQPGRVQQMKLEQERIRSLLESEKGRRFLVDAQKKMNEARAGAMSEGRDYWGRSINASDQRIDQISTLVGAADKTTDEKLVASLTSQAQLLTDEMGEESKRKKKEDKLGFSPEGIDPIDRGVRLGGGLKSLPKAQDLLFGEDDFVGPPAPVTQEAHGPNVPGMPEVSQRYMESQSPADYFQAPKTFEQVGITSVDEQATLQEMQQALPDIDMKAEYEADPEYMQKLIKLWREKKLNKQNLHKAFSALLQRAQESLGTA